MKIGFVGLGRMGFAMAKRLLDAGHEVSVYNRTRKKAEELSKSGARVTASPAEAADAEVVLSMLSDDAAVKDVVFRGDGILSALRPGKTHVSMSTISPSLAKRLTEAHASRGQFFVSATVLGRPEAAAEGKLFIMPAGDPDAAERVRPLFEVLGQETFDLGSDPVASNLVKLSCNFLIAAVIEGLSEAFALVRKSGCIEPKRYLEILNGTLFSGSVLKIYGQRALDHAFEPAGFTVALGLKDLELGMGAGKELGVPMPLASLIRDHFVSGIAQGFGQMDWSSLAWVALRAAGVFESGDADQKRSA